MEGKWVVEGGTRERKVGDLAGEEIAGDTDNSEREDTNRV